MCEIGATCPNCGQVDLDSDETSCMIFAGMAYREYRCRACRALITVEVASTEPEPVPSTVSVWGRWALGGRQTALLPGDGPPID